MVVVFAEFQGHRVVVVVVGMGPLLGPDGEAVWFGAVVKKS